MESYSTHPSPGSEGLLFEDREVLTENWEYESSKTRNALMIVGAVFLLGDLLSVASIGAFAKVNYAYLMIVPAVFMGLGLFAADQPRVAALTGCVAFLLLTGITVYVFGGLGLITGWLAKAVIVFFLLSALRHGREAEDFRKRLHALK
jgi:hypothetical protein